MSFNSSVASMGAKKFLRVQQMCRHVILNIVEVLVDT